MLLPTARNVIPFTHKPAADDQPVPVARLRAALHQFDELRRCAERLAADPHWSALEWRSASSWVLVHLPKTRESLAALDPIRVGSHADTGWAARIRTACCQVERRLADIGISMSAATSMESSTPDTVATVLSDAALLAAALGDLCGLIARHYPAIAGDRN